MPTRQPTPEHDRVADALRDHWVDTRAPLAWRPYLRLSRIERPIGTWLLLIPCWWGIALGALWGGHLGWYDLYLALACALGAFLMRGAGCTWNDIADRDIDRRVARTANRPLATGAVTPKQAALWMAAQALLAFAVLLTFNTAAVILGVLALVPAMVYPFAKRFTWWPQAFLGLAFNWGALLGFAAHSGTLAWPTVVLYGAGIAWTLFYDTIYAQQDIEDDALGGVRSTARLFAGHSRAWLALFAAIAAVLMGLAVYSAGGGWAGLAAALGFAAHMGWIWRRFDENKPARLLKLFHACRDSGLIPLIMLCLAALA